VISALHAETSDEVSIFTEIRKLKNKYNS